MYHDCSRLSQFRRKNGYYDVTTTLSLGSNKLEDKQVEPGGGVLTKECYMDTTFFLSMSEWKELIESDKKINNIHHKDNY